MAGENTQAEDEIDDLLASLDAEFGKQAKKPKQPGHKELNKQFHAQNPRLEQGPRGQLERMKFENYYDWEIHRQLLVSKELERAQDLGMPQVQWLPEAQVSYIINQHCGCCKSVTQFIGNSYIRFRGRRRKYRDVSGAYHETAPTHLIRVQECDPDLLAHGLVTGDPLPDLIEEMDETVVRCVSCIRLEQAALDLFIAATQPNPQHELMGEDQAPLPKAESMSTEELRARMNAPIGSRFRFKPKPSDELDIDLEGV